MTARAAGGDTVREAGVPDGAVPGRASSVAGVGEAGGGGAVPGADPVRELIARHRDLCGRATDPLEIAAGLEAAGFATGAAARYRHADVFSLAEELFARVPRRPGEGPADRAPVSWQRPAAGLLHGLLYVGPGAALAAVGARASGAGGGAATAAASVWPAVAALAASGGGPHPPTWRLRLAFAATVGVLLGRAFPAGRPGPVALALALAASMGTAEFAARRYRRTARTHLGTARTVAEFTARTRPLPVLAAGGQLAAAGALSLTALALVPGLLHAAHGGPPQVGPVRWAAQGALALLLFAAVLLLRCGRGRTAVFALAGAGAAVTALTALRFVSPSLPGHALPGHLLSAVTAGDWAQLAACGGAAALLLPYACAVLLRPATHAAPPGGPAVARRPRRSATGGAARPVGRRSGRPRHPDRPIDLRPTRAPSGRTTT